MTLSRRTAMLAIPAALATAPALAGLPAEANDARLIELERRHNAMVDLINTADFTDAQADAHFEEQDGLSDAIIRTPAAGPEGLLVKWRHARYWLNIGWGEPTSAAVDAFEADLVRLVGGAT